MALFVGLMSGTSADGIDAALVSFETNKVIARYSLSYGYPDELRRQLLNAIKPGACLTLDEYGQLNVSVGACFASAAAELIKVSDVGPGEVTAIGSHGQTLRHSPDSTPAYTIQIGDPATIATTCGITTVADFRSLDVAAGGQGAPLVPPFHAAYFRDDARDTVVLNIGGIANISVLPADSGVSVTGIDTGPGNCLLDEWICAKQGKAYDDGGRWAASGTVSVDLLAALMADEYIKRPGIKSTGREYFNLAFVRQVIHSVGMDDLAPVDVQATLAAFTVASVTDAISQAGAAPDRILVCGGGAKNETLMRALRAALPRAVIETTAAYNIDPDMVEASAFAWLAKQRIELRAVQLTTNDNARPRLLGAVYEPTD